MREAWTLQKMGIEMTELFTSGGRTLYPATKAAMDHLGLPGGGTPRPPLRPIEGERLRELTRGVDGILSTTTKVV